MFTRNRKTPVAASSAGNVATPAVKHACQDDQRLVAVCRCAGKPELRLPTGIRYARAAKSTLVLQVEAAAMVAFRHDDELAESILRVRDTLLVLTKESRTVCRATRISFVWEQMLGRMPRTSAALAVELAHKLHLLGLEIDLGSYSDLWIVGGLANATSPAETVADVVGAQRLEVLSESAVAAFEAIFAGHRTVAAKLAGYLRTLDLLEQDRRQAAVARERASMADVEVPAEVTDRITAALASL